MRIKQEVLVVLSTIECVENEARITAGQLDRKLYVEVDKVLKAIGGKWNRGAKAHLFTGDAASLLDAVIVSGEVTTNREIGFFETPSALASELCALADVQEGHACLEPSAGTGRIVEELAKYHPASIDMVEFDRTRAMRLVGERLPGWVSTYYGTRFTVISEDVMNVQPGSLWNCHPVDRVVMNPPFTKVGVGDHLDHVQHAFELLKPDGCLVSVLPRSVTFRQDKRHRAFWSWVEQEHGTIEPLSDDSFKESGTSVRTCVLRLVKGTGEGR